MVATTQGMQHVPVASGEPKAWKKGDQLTLVVLGLVAFLPRIAALVSFLDSPGDGPTRALIAYNWSRSPYLDFSSGWPPGYTYLAGVFHFLIGDPAIASRVLNVIVGTLTVPAFYLLLRRLYGGSVALFAAAALAFLPLHVALSASSMTEASYLFEVVTGILLLILALDARDRRYYWGSLALMYLAVMTRYEAWLLIPVLSGYQYLRTRMLGPSLVTLGVLITFPILWLAGNLTSSGVEGFIVTIRGTTVASRATPTDLFHALRVIAHAAQSHLGPILPLAIAWGALWQLHQAWRKKITLDSLLYLVLLGLVWAFVLSLVMSRGWKIYEASSRYFLFGFVLALPLAAAPFAARTERSRFFLPAAALVAVASLIVPGLVAYRVAGQSFDSSVHLTRVEPTAIKQLGAWLRRSPYRNDAVVATALNWRATYLPLYFPEFGQRYLVLTPWVSDAELQEFLRQQRPTLLITQDGTESDAEARSRIERLGHKIRRDQLVYAQDTLRVYRLET